MKTFLSKILILVLLSVAVGAPGAVFADFPGTTPTEPPSRNLSPYDLNVDGMVDLLDLGIMLLYVGYTEEDPEWDTLVKVIDGDGFGITAYNCDFTGDGEVDMADLVEMIVNLGADSEMHLFGLTLAALDESIDFGKLRLFTSENAEEVFSVVKWDQLGVFQSRLPQRPRGPAAKAANVWTGFETGLGAGENRLVGYRLNDSGQISAFEESTVADYAMISNMFTLYMSTSSTIDDATNAVRIPSSVVVFSVSGGEYYVYSIYDLDMEKAKAWEAGVEYILNVSGDRAEAIKVPREWIKE